MARDGWWFVGPLLGVVAIGMILIRMESMWGWPVVVLGAILTLFFAYFFRDPERTPPSDPDSVVATGDGRIVIVSTLPDGRTQIDTFLSPLDVHITRAAISGTISQSVHRPGQFQPAFRSSAATDNERHDLVTDGAHGVVMSAQIAGVLARRIVCRPKAGDDVRIGQRIGIIKFGSRTQVIVPAGYRATVRVRDRVRAGESIIARWVGATKDNEPESGLA